MSTVTVRLRVLPEKREEFLKIFTDVAAIAEAEEPDCRAYAVWHTGREDEYLLVESYRSEAGRQNHEDMHAGLMEPFMACLAEPPETEVLGDFAFGFPK